MNNEQITLAYSDILTAFDNCTIGSKVTDSNGFLKTTIEAIQAYDFEAQRIPGQGFLVVPEALPFVSAGDGLRTEDPTDYVPALHRGEVSLFLKRERAGEPKFCGLVVYTRDAYLKDPDMDDKETARILAAPCTHVLVAVIVSSGPEAPLTPGRLVANLAGGNREALVWTADEIREKARASHEFWTKYAVVAG